MQSEITPVSELLERVNALEEEIKGKKYETDKRERIENLKDILKMRGALTANGEIVPEEEWNSKAAEFRASFEK